MGRSARFAVAAVITSMLAIAPLSSVRAATAPNSSPVLVSFGEAGSYHALGGGHDGGSYWIWYRYGDSGPHFAVLIRVQGGLPQHFAFALKAMARPNVGSDRSQVVIVGSGLPAAVKQDVRGSIAAVTRSAFFQLAAGTPNHIAKNVDQHALHTPGLTVPVNASAEGALSSGVLYVLRWGSAGRAFALPLTYRPPPIAEALCGGADVHHTVDMALMFSPSVKHFTVSANGHTLASTKPAIDPTAPSVSVFAVSVPGSTKSISWVLNGSVHSGTDVASCVAQNS